MKIVFASYVYSPGFSNPESWLNRINFYTGILEALAAKQQVISIEQIDYEGEYLNKGVHYHFKRFSKIGLIFPLQMHQFIKGLEPDIVFIHGLHFPLQLIQFKLCLGSATRIIVQHHAEQPFTGVKKLLQQLADRGVDAYLFASRELGMEWVEKGNLQKADKIQGVMEVSSVFYPVDKDIALAKTGINGAPIFLWVGRLNQNKDPLNVVKAFLKFAEVNISARLYMIYQTEELLPEVLALLDEQKAPCNLVTLVGKVSRPDLLYWFNSADFLISGSFYEAAGVAVCEAMSCGCIPVLTDISSFRMMTNNGNCGLLYEPGSEAALLSALQKTQEMDIEEGKKKSIKYFQSNLSFQAIAQGIERVVTSI
ncbi:glycosyltransferase family 4 protein [Mucilaginibacter paludis]|uniref:Glycosyl transferase group 1 n=1 Tax=Mucilaginibacter paludis DSM 18603 TaxID=714943 RepID=H1YGA8_9SPHI|nr:glycosyltransferase family 4 protein [Mucilaginibacter paludis]EHQ27372.1 glycosyl transferase group 1 [Mucilaginibacter paludis DSM 18603]